MATNRVREHATRLALPVPDGTVSGEPLVIGALPCVAVTDADEWTEGEASVQTDGSFRFEVAGPIGVGDGLAVDMTPATPGDADFFGYALEEVDNGDTIEIEVKVGY